MSGTFPAFPSVSDVSIESITPTRISTTYSLKRQTRASNTQRWGLELQFPPMKREKLAPILGFCMEQEGQHGKFEYILPAHPPLGIVAGTPVFEAKISSKQVTITGFTIDEPDLLEPVKAGDFFKFDNHDKVYMATKDSFLQSPELGTVDIEFYPPLIEDPVFGEPFILIDVPFTMSLSSDVLEMNIGTNLFYEFSLSLIEDV